MPSNQRLVAVVLSATVVLLFLEPIHEAVETLDLGDWTYAAQAGLVLEQLPLLVALLALVIIGGFITKS